MEADCPYVSRGGLKLAAALDAFGLDPAGWVCADLGCSTGGFADCLLQHGAARVYAVDTAYGELAWKLRQDPRVTVLERTNALHFDPWRDLADAGFAGCDLVVVDLGWTVQARAVPAALRWLRPEAGAHAGDAAAGGDAGVSGDATAEGSRGGRDLPGIVSLVKPHYEATTQAMGPAGERGGGPRGAGGRGGRGRGGAGGPGRRGVLDDAEAQRVLANVLAGMPELGVRSAGHLVSPIRGGKGGNIEYLALLKRI